MGQTHVHDLANFFLVKWDSGAFQEPAWRNAADGSVAALAGDPLLFTSSNRLSRKQQLDRLAPHGAAPDDAELAKCRGSFALVHHDAKSNQLYLTTDALGLRSIYYVVQDGCLIFSTALRVLEAMPEVKKKLSLLGMAELSVFTFPLAERTPYEGITVLRECQALTANASGVTLHNYDDWSTLQGSPETPEQAAKQLHSTFREAVSIRLGSDQKAYSFLSGGMDSRAIVATLLDLGRQVEALNFSPQASQDQLYAQLFSAETGGRCSLHCLAGGVFPNFTLLAHAAKTELEQRQQTHVDRPAFIWSGDGGSVGLGHVYMDTQMLAHAQRGDVQAAVQHFLNFNNLALSSKVFTKTARQQLPQLLLDSVMREVHRYPRQDLGRQLYFFLLFNDQRRHLFKHFESIDQHGLEVLTPFFDTLFLKAVASTPVHWGVLHRLYAEWFTHLPEFARKTPWQTYPGHVPCPVAGARGASYQWAPTPKQREGLVARNAVARALLRSVSHDLAPPFSQARVGVAAVLHALGLRDCRHILWRLELYERFGIHTQKTGI
ncbi:MAG: hypothetical protein H7293_00690 [Candidatus Saccharibacteria bacterium]|nr:hypothetical protein [Rhodoferax sp.]